MLPGLAASLLFRELLLVTNCIIFVQPLAPAILSVAGYDREGLLRFVLVLASEGHRVFVTEVHRRAPLSFAGSLLQPEYNWWYAAQR